MKRIFVASMLCLLTGAFIAAPARADGKGVLCAAVQPECTEEGLPLPPFDTGECAELFALRCAKMASLPIDTACQAEKENLGKEVRRLAKQLRAAKRKKQNAE